MKRHKKLSNEEKIAEFGRKINWAHANWDQTLVGWLIYHEAKQQAYEELVEQLNEIAYIEGFWRIVSGGGDWELRLLEAIKALHKGTPCRSCGAAKVKWPDRNCETCIAAKRHKLEATKESRKALRKRKRLKTKPKSITKWKLCQTKRR